MKPFFSVVMPVYNVENDLRLAVDSVLKQDDRDFELILVDDGSKDASPKICDEYAEKHDFIRVIHKENGGLASARNAGIEASRGQYILMPDSDDTIEPDTLSSVRKAIDEAKETGARVDIVHYDMVWHMSKGNISIACSFPSGLYEGERVRDILEASLLFSDRYSLSACIIACRKVFLDENELRFVSEREVLSEDFLFSLSALLTAQSVYVMNKVQYHYYTRSGSLTHSAKPRMAERYTKLYEELCKYAREHGADEKIQKQIASFYLIKLIYRNYIHAEYTGRNGTSWAEARKNVRAVMRNPAVRAASKRMDRSRLDTKDKIRAICIRFGLEPVLAYSYRQNRKR